MWIIVIHAKPTPLDEKRIERLSIRFELHILHREVSMKRGLKAPQPYGRGRSSEGGLLDEKRIERSSLLPNSTAYDKSGSMKRGLKVMPHIPAIAP